MLSILASNETRIYSLRAGLSNHSHLYLPLSLFPLLPSKQGILHIAVDMLGADGHVFLIHSIWRGPIMIRNLLRVHKSLNFFVIWQSRTVRPLSNSDHRVPIASSDTNDSYFQPLMKGCIGNKLEVQHSKQEREMSECR
jgi:hypothetical protein